MAQKETQILAVQKGNVIVKRDTLETHVLSVQGGTTKTMNIANVS